MFGFVMPVVCVIMAVWMVMIVLVIMSMLDAPTLRTRIPCTWFCSPRLAQAYEKMTSDVNTAALTTSGTSPFDYSEPAEAVLPTAKSFAMSRNRFWSILPEPRIGKDSIGM